MNLVEVAIYEKDQEQGLRQGDLSKLQSFHKKLEGKAR